MCWTEVGVSYNRATVSLMAVAMLTRGGGAERAEID